MRVIILVPQIHVPQRRAVPTRVPHITRAARETPVRRLTRAQQKIRVRHIILGGQGALVLPIRNKDICNQNKPALLK
ncbi:hypothetical protein SAMN02744133_106278 [Thalassospira xiamenensis M-5 = DSM 17429]|nr:hypothetical protein SAMN02744133_106278 [Thalassospira xiamenensis M-5 = DSM 17429]